MVAYELHWLATLTEPGSLHLLILLNCSRPQLLFWGFFSSISSHFSESPRHHSRRPGGWRRQILIRFRARHLHGTSKCDTCKNELGEMPENEKTSVRNEQRTPAAEPQQNTQQLDSRRQIRSLSMMLDSNAIFWLSCVRWPDSSWRVRTERPKVRTGTNSTSQWHHSPILCCNSGLQTPKRRAFIQLKCMDTKEASKQVPSWAATMPTHNHSNPTRFSRQKTPEIEFTKYTKAQITQREERTFLEERDWFRSPFVWQKFKKIKKRYLWRLEFTRWTIVYKTKWNKRGHQVRVSYRNLQVREEFFGTYLWVCSVMETSKQRQLRI